MKPAAAKVSAQTDRTTKESDVYHPILLQREVLQEMPALLDDLRPRVDEAAHFSYRSEAFAEDLADEDVEPAWLARSSSLWLFAAPLSTAVAGALVALLQQAA
jgi:hypothetical protein